jgi:hypothetical protein
MLMAPASALAAGGPGTPPVLTNDVITTAEDTPATGNVLDNDTNSSGLTPFTVTTYTTPAASVGTLVINSDGSYTFTPAPNFNGTGSATYMASNTKHEVGPATITINVTAVPDPPTANDDTVTVVEDTATDVKSAILANDVNPDGTTNSVTAVANVTGGAVDLSGGLVTFTPNANLCGAGAGSFDYTLSTTGGTSNAHVTVNITCVNDPPVAHNDSASGTEDTDVVIAGSDLVANDTDVEGDTLSVSAVSNPSGGTVSLDSGTITFTPTANLCGVGAASFDYTVSDGNGGHDTGHVTIDLTCTPDPPVAHNDTVSGTEDTALLVPASDLTANDTDPDGDTLSVTAVSNPSGGTVSLDSGTITFTPDANACGNGEGSFDYTVDDGGNGGSDTGHVTVNLACVNDAPVANDDTVTASENTPSDVTSQLLSNDTDVDGDTLSVSAVSNPTGGVVDLTGGIVTFTPDQYKCGVGEGSFDYTVTDGTDTSSASVTVDVTCTNHDPVAVDDTASGTEDTDVTIAAGDLTANDTDVDGDTLSVSAVSNASGGTVSLDSGTITFTPDANACGTGEGSFDYTVVDGNGGSDTGSVSVDITCVNDAPVAGADTVSGTEDTDVVTSASDLLANDTDVENDPLSVTGVSNPTGGTVSLDSGNITFTPDANVCGTGAGSYDYTLSDGTNTATGHVSVDLTCVNDNPVANDDTVQAVEDTQLVISDLSTLTGNDTDVDGDTVSLTGVSNPTGGTVAYDSDAGTVTFTPDANVCGTGAGGFDYAISDGNGGTANGHVTVDITCVNDAPVANGDTANGTEDTDLVISDLSTLTANDTDVDGDTLNVTGASNPTGGTVAFDGVNGKITFTPTANLCGENVAGFDYTVSDGFLSDTGHVTVSLDCVNDNPTAVNDVATVQENSAAADHNVLGNDSDIDGDSPLLLTGVQIDDPAHGTASVNGSMVSYTPANGWFGTTVITYTVDDQHGGSAQGTLTVTVTAVNIADTTPPKVNLPTLALGTSGRVDTTYPVMISWSATDAGSGVASYQVQISINGKPFTALSTGSKTSIKKVLPLNQSFVLRIRATDHSGNTSAWRTTPKHWVAAIQNISKAVKFSKPWTFVYAPASSGGGYSFTTALGRAASYQFGGAQIAFIAPKMSNGGFAKVYLDGKLLGRYSLKSAKLLYGQIIATWKITTAGPHVIRVVNDQNGKRATLDAFVVLK